MTRGHLHGLRRVLCLQPQRLHPARQRAPLLRQLQVFFGAGRSRQLLPLGLQLGRASCQPLKQRVTLRLEGVPLRPQGLQLRPHYGVLRFQLRDIGTCHGAGLPGCVKLFPRAGQLGLAVGQLARHPPALLLASLRQLLRTDAGSIGRLQLGRASGELFPQARGHGARLLRLPRQGGRRSRVRGTASLLFGFKSRPRRHQLSARRFQLLKQLLLLLRPRCLRQRSLRHSGGRFLSQHLRLALGAGEVSAVSVYGFQTGNQLGLHCSASLVAGH